MKPGKSPGPDGYTLLYYKTFQEKLISKFLEAFNSLKEGHQMRRETLGAHIAVIPKEGKDPTVCASYRPISLLNIDLKIFSKIIANKLATNIPSLIHPDQVGFVLGREGRQNTQRVLNTIYLAQVHHKPLALISTDAEKAFDRVDWGF